MPTKNIDLPTLISRFSDEDACHAYLEDLRWPDGVSCPGREGQECGSTRIDRLKKRRLFECRECGYQFSVRVGTIFHDSKLPLWKWFLAVYMMVQSRKGISANQVKRMLGVSYKTAWYLCHRIREAMKDDDAAPLAGIVEADESFLGGKRRGGGAGPSGKVIVMGAVERGGRVRLKHTPNRRLRQVHSFIEESVSKKAKAVHTDKYNSYRSAVLRLQGPAHETVNRAAGEWVHGKVHTNTIEGVWSLLDRSIIGAYHKVSTKHLQRYLEEVEWRYNNRSNPYLFRDTILELVAAERLEYKALTA